MFVNLNFKGIAVLDRIAEVNKQKKSDHNKKEGVKKMIDKIALLLVIIGGINWGSIGIFQFDLVAWIGGGQSGMFSRIIYVLVAISAIWCISLLFRDDDAVVHEAR